MFILVFNVGKPAYADDAIRVLSDYFSRNRLQWAEVKDISSFNTKNAHPSWLKLLAHQIAPGNDFILNWDLDLLPLRKAHSIEHVIDKSKMNMAVDSSLLAGYPGYNPNFRYNGGLMGIPASMAAWTESIYNRHAPGVYPSFEQYYLNDAIVADNVSVHRLPDVTNTLFPRNAAGNVLWREAMIKHYTFGVMDPKDKAAAIKEHCDEYFRS